MIKVNELFAGIGAFRKALERLKLSMAQLETMETFQRSQNSTMPIYGLTAFRVRTFLRQVIKQESSRVKLVVVSCMRSTDF